LELDGLTMSIRNFVQWLDRRIAILDEVREAVSAWQNHRDHLYTKVNWLFTTKDVRIKLKSPCQTPDA